MGVRRTRIPCPYFRPAATYDKKDRCIKSDKECKDPFVICAIRKKCSASNEKGRSV